MIGYNNPIGSSNKFRLEESSEIYRNMFGFGEKLGILGLHSEIIKWASAQVPPTPLIGGGTGNQPGEYDVAHDPTYIYIHNMYIHIYICMRMFRWHVGLD